MEEPVAPDSVFDTVQDGSATCALVTEFVTSQPRSKVSMNPPEDVTTSLTVVGLNGSVPLAELVAVE
jgi:hypothetical protein